MTMPLAVSNARTPARFRLSQTVLMRSERHGEPVIAEAIELRGAELLLAGDDHAVGGFERADAGALQVVADGADAVGLLDSKLAGIFDLHAGLGSGAEIGRAHV